MQQIHYIMENKKDYLYQIISALSLAALALLIGKVLDLVDAKAIVFSALLFILIILIQTYISWHNSRKFDTRLEEKLTEFSNNTKEVIDNTINRILITQNNNFKTDEFSNVLNIYEVYEIESFSKEIWIFAKNLEYEMTDNELTELVLSNLKKGCIYYYLVPDTQKIRQRVKNLLIKFKKEKIPRENIQFRFKERSLLMSYFGITIYNPTIANKVNSNLDPTVVFFPDSKVISSKNDRVFVSIFGQETISVQEDYIELWENSKIATLNDNDLLEIQEHE